jgi:methyl-accepting chemotaxis protein
MKSATQRIIGAVLILTAIAGLVFNLAGLVFIWRVKQPFTHDAVQNVHLIRTTLQTTSDGLAIADSSITSSIRSLTDLELTINTTAQTIDTTTPMVDSLVTLMKSDLPDTITHTQTSLASAQESAKIIDSVLRTITSLPLVPNVYNPPVPLDVALGQVSSSLDGLPDKFNTMGDNLSNSKKNMATIKDDIDTMSANILGIKTNLEDAQKVVREYRTTLSDLQTRLQKTENSLPGWITAGTWVLTFFLVWLALTQVGLLFQGMEMMGYRLDRD